MVCSRRYAGLFSSLALVAATFVAAASHGALTAEGEPSLKQGASVTVTEAVAELLRLLRDRNLLAADDAELRRALIKAVIEAADCNAMLAVDDGGDAAASTVDATVGMTATVGGMFRYVQLTAVDERAAEDLAAELGDIQYGHYEGVIVDLRYTGGDSVSSARKATETLASSELPVVVLINRETVAAAEVLAALTQRQCKATVVGEPSRGFPFPWHRVKLASGEIILLPKVEQTPAEGHWRPTPLQPDVLVNEQPSRQSLRTASLIPGAGFNGDACLRQAIDLLKAITALGSKHF